jgi:predicted Zn-dependent peptidase
MKIGYFKKELANGLRLICVPQKSIDLVAVKIFIKVGSKDDAKNFGITHFLEHILFQNRKNNKEVFHRIERYGGILNANTSRDNMAIYFVVDKYHLYYILPAVLDMLFDFDIDNDLIEGEKKVILQEILSHQNAPEAVWDLFAIHYWKNNPIRYPIRGYITSVRNITCNQLKEHYNHFFHNDNIVISCAGDIQEEKLTVFLENYLEQITGEYQSKVLNIPVEELTYSERVIIERDLLLTHIFIAFQIPPFGHADIFYLKALSMLLAGGAYSRLYRLLREEEHLVYSVEANALTYSDAGIFLIHTKCCPDKVNSVENHIYEQIDLLKNQPIGDEELEFIKTQYAGNLLRNFETLLSKCSILGIEELLTSKPLSFDETLKHFLNIDKTGLQEKTDQYLKSGRTIIIGKLC